MHASQDGTMYCGRNYRAACVVRTQQIADLNCTEVVQGVAKYAPSAVNCANKMSDESCAILYPNPVKVHTNNLRDVKCTGNPPALNPQLIEAAIQLCPKTCGYCCLTPAYSCRDKAQPRVPCSSVTPTMCKSQAWRTILESDCPKTCGLCDSGQCIDKAPGCNLFGGFVCHSKTLQSFARRYCKRTCGFCDDTTTTKLGAATRCGTNPNCASWIRNGFCESPYYTLEFKMRFCGRECGLC
ncbi:ShTK domain protein [Trichostrongylus colubriformis]|uniref:ShTK domain protein n=1 Tax=Trichostrongylus colubriformis TaxID=6319 RepID=A0AAN8FIN8_TRICO